MPLKRRWLVIGGALLLVGCTDYDVAVECTGVYGAFSEHDSGFVRLQRLAEGDAANKGRTTGRTPDQIANDIEAVKRKKRQELAGPWRTSKSRQRCDALYE